MYAFLRGDTPFCPPVGKVRQQPLWNPYGGLPGNLQPTFQRAPLHALLVSRSYITYEEAMSSFPHWMRRWHRPLANGSNLGWSKIILRSGSTPVWCPHSPGPRYVVPWYEALTVGVNLGSTCSQTIRRLEKSWAGPVKYCRSSINRCATSQLLRWPPGLMWGRCGCMTGSCGGSFQRQQDSGPWPYWWGPSNLHGSRGDDAQGHVTEVLLSPLEGGDNVAADARHTLGALGLGAFVEARSGEQCMVIASARGPGLAGVDVIGEIVQDYGWELVTNSAQSLRVV